LKPAIEVIKRIQWDPKLKKEDFTVVYEDRFIGDLEVPLEEFVHGESKSHRVRLFKCKGEIVWDKRNKIDKFKDLIDEENKEKDK